MAARCTGDYVTSMLVFRAEKRSAQASAYPLSQAQGGLFCLLTDCWLRLFMSFCESSDWEGMNYTRCERLLHLKPFLFVFVVVVVAFSSLENYYGFRTTSVRVKTDHSFSLRWNKTFWTFPKRFVFFWLCIRFVSWFCVQCFAFFRRAELKPACILLLVVTVGFFTCPDLFTFAEPALFLSSVKEP